MQGQHISCSVRSFEPLSHSHSAVDKVALVTEGGGQRGIFTAGVLDAFLEADFNPFSLLIGTSAGSLNLASYICGQNQHAYRVITEATTAQDFFDLFRFLRGGEGLNLDWLVEQTQTRLRLDWQKGHSNMQGRTVLACASHADTFETHYFDLDNEHWDMALKASCAIPMLHRKPVCNEHEPWFDGGVTAPIPVEEAYARGYRHIVVIRTVPIHVEYHHDWIGKFKGAFGKTKVADMIELLLEHEASYRQTQSFLNNPPDDVTIYEIFPPKPLQSSLLGSALLSLETDYQLGYQSGRYFLSTLGRRFSHLQPNLSPDAVKHPERSKDE